MFNITFIFCTIKSPYFLYIENYCIWLPHFFVHSKKISRTIFCVTKQVVLFDKISNTYDNDINVYKEGGSCFIIEAHEWHAFLSSALDNAESLSSINQY